MSKPTFVMKPIADTYSGPAEKIVEFGNGKRSATDHKGGLIALNTEDNGTLHVSLYRLDPGVKVSVSGDDNPYAAALAAITRTMAEIYNNDPNATVDTYLNAVANIR